MTHGTGQLLFDEAPIAVSPSLVRLFGLPEATLLQQVHFRIWCKRGDPSQYAAHFIEGRYWVHWTMAELQRAVPLGATSSDPYKRVIRGLQALGILLVEQHRRSQWDRTNWYSIDYDALERYVAAHGDSGGGPTGGNATNRDTAFPSIDQRRSAASTRGDSATHSQSKSSSKTSNETTTTTPAPKPAEKLASSGGGVQDDPRALDLTALPDGLHLGVLDLVRPRTDAQRFVDLLAARLKRDVDLPAPRQLKNPLLWLRSLMVGEGVIDFCEADRLSDERDPSRPQRYRLRSAGTRPVGRRVHCDQRAPESQRRERRSSMRTRTSGILCDRSGERTVNKQYKGERIFARLGRVSQDDAETWLRARQAELDVKREHELREGSQQLFAAAAAKYLIECKQREVRTLDLIAGHVNLLLPYIGSLRLQDVCNDSLETFKEERLAAGVKPSTVNRTLEVARTVLTRAARVWRTNGKPWLSTAPLIEMLDERQQRRPPYPITWSEQAELMKHLPAHLQRMVLFALNCGARDDNVCKLQWAWERKVPELDRSVFVVPAEEFKGKRPHVLVLNDVAARIVEECRGAHDEYVFVWRRERVKNFEDEPVMPYRPVHTMNNTAFQSARRAAKLDRVRVHDLRHTFGQRLRDAGVAEEDRALLLGHAINGMPQHYATATIARLVEAANKVQETRDRTTLLRVVNG